MQVELSRDFGKNSITQQVKFSVTFNRHKLSISAKYNSTVYSSSFTAPQGSARKKPLCYLRLTLIYSGSIYKNIAFVNTTVLVTHKKYTNIFRFDMKFLCLFSCV